MVFGIHGNILRVPARSACLPACTAYVKLPRPACINDRSRLLPGAACPADDRTPPAFLFQKIRPGADHALPPSERDYPADRVVFRGWDQQPVRSFPDRMDGSAGKAPLR